MTIRQASNNSASGAAVASWQLGLLAVGTFTLGMDGFVLSGLLPQIAADLEVSVSAAGQLMTIFAIAYAVGSPVIATVTGALDRRLVLAGGMIIFLIGMAAQALGPNYPVVAVGRVVAAIGAAGFQSNAYAVAGILAGPERRGRALATIAAGTTVSTVIGTPFGVLIGQWWGWRAALWVITGLSLVSAVVVPLLPAVRLPVTSLGARLRVLGDRRILAMLGCTMLILIPGFAVQSYLPVLIAPVATGALLVVALTVRGLGQVIGNQLAGTLIDRRGPFGVLVVATAGTAVATIVLAPARHSLVPMLIMLLVLGLLAGANIVPQQHRLVSASGDLAAVALGLNGSAIYVGIALGGAVGGLTIKVAGVAWLPVVGAVSALLALAVIVGTAPERRHPVERSPANLRRQRKGD
ncbi:MFS transporter [Microlunatus soli]|uniref:Predicted arabinose efflux permease, MFS family n=1 Tax=Microlunatus soli TaxID=630515 RepID=A0A1H1SRG6_9ACTN|nr:MFS transporter [Microlunatus soli]SDS50574.1 Predicted arabinose efflux permease, MFS family [Microlunatus soli]